MRWINCYLWLLLKFKWS